MPPNVFRAFLSQKLEAGGSETTIYIDRITTLTGETITTSDFSDFGRGVITVNPDGNGIDSYPEFISFTGVSGNTLTGAIRGLSAKSNSVITANKRFHPDGTPVIIAVGYHAIKDLFDYIDQEIAALTVGANVTVLATAGESVSAGNLVYLKNDGKWWKTDADTIATLDNVILGIAQGSGSADGAITNGVTTQGLDSNQSGLTAGTTYYASNTAGAISPTPGTNSLAIGVARSTTTLYFDPKYSLLPKIGEKAAAAGGGSFGTPSNTNKFVTEQLLTTKASVQRIYNRADSPATWTKPANLDFILVELWGGGGSGGSRASDLRISAGAGGAYNSKIIRASDLGSTETITIGAGGASVTNTQGNAGGTSSFGSHVSAFGGGAGAASSSTTVFGAGGGGQLSAGVGLTGAVNAAGGSPGFPSSGFGSPTVLGTKNGTFGGGGSETNAVGGNSIYGGAAGGGANNSAGGVSVFGGNGGAGSSASGVAATAGAVPGGGGGAGLNAASGAGGNGRVIVTEYYI